MKKQAGLSLLGSTLAIAALVATSGLDAQQPTLALDSARVTVSGTSNIHAYTASTTQARVTRADIAPADGSDVWARALSPGGLRGLEIVVPAATLSSPKEGLDKNMHKALRVAKYPEIGFRLVRLEAIPSGDGKFHAVSVLRIAGAEREVTLTVSAARRGAALFVEGQTTFLMTDFGIQPPVAMMGMLKTDPKVTVKFETLFSVPLT